MWTKFTEVDSEKYWLVRALEAEQAPKKRLFWGVLEGTDFKKSKLLFPVLNLKALSC
jgi:hypothetical protein